MKYAIFDLDGTVVNGYISTEFIHHLFGKGLFDAAEYGLFKTTLQSIREDKVTYDQFIDDWANSWARGISGQKVTDIETSSKHFIADNNHLFYDEAKEITKCLKKYGFKTYILSVGMSELVNLSCDCLNVDAAISTKVEHVNGIYTGKLLTTLHKINGKGLAIDNIIAKEESGNPYFAFGDSAGDTSMLERATYPVATNPQPELCRIANERNWHQFHIGDALGFVEDICSCKNSSNFFNLSPL